MTMIKVKMYYSKSTKNKHVYSASSTEAVETIYINKLAFDGEPPKEIMVEVELVK